MHSSMFHENKEYFLVTDVFTVISCNILCNIDFIISLFKKSCEVTSHSIYFSTIRLHSSACSFSLIVVAMHYFLTTNFRRLASLILLAIERKSSYAVCLNNHSDIQITFFRPFYASA